MAVNSGTRERLLVDWARFLLGAAQRGAFGRGVAIQRVRGIAGPRAGALEVYAGMGCGRMLTALARQEGAVLRQLVPWQFVGEPAAFMSGRALRVEAGWPEGMAERVIRLGDLATRPRGSGRWVLGRDERGATVVAGLSDRTPHFLVSGATGSGKSVGLRGAVAQLAADGENRLVLLDGKWGESLAGVGRLPGVVGPVATEGPEMRAALGWVCAEMRRRYEGQGNGRVVVVFDEFQEAMGDGVIAELVRRIASQGRGAGVHLLAATHHPTVDVFGHESTRRNLVGKVALRVGDPDASRVAVGGSTPRADFLLGAGDAYVVAPGAVHRVQMAYVDEGEVTRFWEAQKPSRGGERFEAWPTYEAEGVGGGSTTRFSGAEIAISVLAAQAGVGRPTLRRVVRALTGRPIGGSAGGDLRDLGREVSEWYRERGFVVGRVKAGR